MSEPSKRNFTISLGGLWFWLIIAILIILCAGQPDLLDAIIAWVGRQP